jgi:catechol 2,3-dioxygenase-like lactoylglutathione lyase family enzyme
MVHFNVDCSDYERSLAFYRALGFEEVWRVPETNTPEVAAATARQRIASGEVRSRCAERNRRW